MRYTTSILLLFAILTSCEKIVDIKETAPIEVVSCDLDQDLEGRWSSDSVHLTTTVDTIDSMIINRNPTIVYYLDAYCDSLKFLRLSYYNYAGAYTEDVQSTNYETSNGRVYVYDAFDTTRDSTKAGFKMAYSSLTDSSVVIRFDQKPNPDQETSYALFMRKL